MTESSCSPGVGEFPGMYDLTDTPLQETVTVTNPAGLIHAVSQSDGFTHLGMAPGAEVVGQDSQDKSGNSRFIITTAFPDFRLELRAGDSLENFRTVIEKIEQHLGQNGLSGALSDDNTPFAGGFIGFAAYELGFFSEPSLIDLAAGLPEDMLLLSACFFGWALIQDLQNNESYVLFHPNCKADTRQTVRAIITSTSSPDPEQSQVNGFTLIAPFRPLEPRGTYLKNFRRVQKYIQAGECYQANLAQCFQAPFKGNPWQAFCQLSHAFPTPFSAFIDLDEQQIISLSPERFLSIDGGRVETKPIKGTRRRGVTPEEDDALRAELAASEKDRAENLMIVDLLRNDLGRSCVTGSIKVDRLFEIETYKNVHHLVSTISGRLGNGITPLRALMNAYPGGSITGAPKIRSMEIIHELEGQPRGPYCGSIFYLSCNHRMDSSIAIRTALCRNGTISFLGGGGVVADSEAESEYQETLTKVRPMMEALEAEALVEYPAASR